MKIAVRHNLQVYDPADTSLCEDAAIVLPVREARAVMGETVSAYLARVEWHFDLPTVCRINGEYYGRAEWQTRALAVNDNIEFVSRPLGGSGGSTGKTIMSIVALVALTAVAGPAGTALSGALGLSGFAAAAVSAAASAIIVGAGSLALSYFMKPKSGGKSGTSDALYNFGLQGNAARPLQPIPVLNGRLKFAPDYAAPTYSEYDGDSMKDYALYAVTCGRWRPEQVLIGDTPIWDSVAGFNPDYPGIELQFAEPGEQVTLYPVNVVTSDELSGAELSTTYTPGYIVNAAGTLAKELLLDFVWPGGAYHTSKDKILKADTHILVRVRTVDDAGAPKGQWTEIFGNVYTNKKQSQIRITVRITVPPDRYQVSVRRVNEPTAEGNGTDSVTWTALRAHIEGPQSFPRVSTLAVKGVASKELSGVSGGQLRVIGTRILPVWKNGQFVEEPTRSIAWAALDWWRNGDYAAGLSISDTDFQAFVRYDALWTALGHTFDRRTTEAQTLDDILETVLKAGRAFPSPVGDKITITRDEPRGLPRMLFTENDIVRDSLEISYALSEQAWADGFVGEYVDEDTWRLAEVSSAPDGVRLLNPARVQIEGIVNRKQATGFIRFMAAESQFRRITASWTARMEGRLLKRGDLVKLSAEEPETWGQSCEVLSIDQDGVTLTLDPAPVWESGSRHYIEIRRRDARPWGPHPVTRGRDDRTAVVNPEGDIEGLEDALMRSETQEAPWVAFSPGQPRTFPVLITEGDPDQDGEHIHLTGVVDASEVYATTENGVPPLIQVPDLFSSSMPVILGLNARASQRQLTIILTAGWQPAKNAASYIADVSYDGGKEYIRAYEGDRSTFEAVVGGSDQMRVRVAGVTPDGARGAFYVVEVTVPDLVVSNDTVALIEIDYADLTQSVKDRVDYSLQVEAHVQEVAATSLKNFQQALGRANEVQAYAEAVSATAVQNFNTAIGRADTALAKALESLGNDVTNAARITSEENTRLTADQAITTSVQTAVSRIDGNTAAIITEASTRATADTAQTTRTTALIAQTDSDRAYFLSEQQARISKDEAYASDLFALQARVGRAEASVIDERTARVTADSATATRIDGLSANIGSSSALVTEEARVRVEQDNILATRITSVVSQTDNDRAYFLSEQSTRISNDIAAVRDLSTLGTRIGTNSADIISERVARTTADESIATSLTGLNTRVGNNEAAIVSESRARSDADSATATRIDGITASVGSGSGSITEEARVRAEQDGILSTRITSVVAQTDSDRTYFLSEQTARISRDETISTNLSSLVAQTSSDRTYFLAEQQVRITKDNATATDISALYANYNNNVASINSLTQIVANNNSAQVSTNTDLYARSDFGTASGRIGYSASSGPSGVSARISALVTTSGGGQLRGAGYYLDLMNDGTSKFVVDADAFYITKNGSSIPLLSFDGITLRVPNLQLTAPNVPVGVANTASRFDASQYTLIAGAGSVNNAIDANMVVNISVDNGVYPTMVSLYGNVELGTQSSLTSVDLLIDGVRVAPMIFEGLGTAITTINNPARPYAFQAFALLFLSPGNHQARFRYNYLGQVAGSSVTIKDIHLAATTARA